MSRGRLDRLRLIINLTSLAASLLFIIGAGWSISTGVPVFDKPPLARAYGLLINAWAAHQARGLAGKALALLVASAMLALLVLALLLSFKANIEDWVVVALAPPIYLMVVCITFMFLSFAVSVIRQAFV